MTSDEDLRYVAVNVEIVLSERFLTILSFPRIYRLSLSRFHYKIVLRHLL